MLETATALRTSASTTATTSAARVFPSKAVVTIWVVGSRGEHYWEGRPVSTIGVDAQPSRLSLLHMG